MWYFRTVAFLGLIGTVAAGCSPATPAPAVGQGPVVADKGPKFESELTYSWAIGEAKFEGAHRGSRYDGDKSIKVGERWSSTSTAGDTKLVVTVAFVGHRDGKDVFKFTSSLTEGGKTVTRDGETEYDGKRTVVLENKFGSMVVQPPTP